MLFGVPESFNVANLVRSDQVIQRVSGDRAFQCFRNRVGSNACDFVPLRRGTSSFLARFYFDVDTAYGTRLGNE